MEHCDFELSVGFAGAVKFNAVQKRAVMANLEAEEEMLSKKLASLRSAIEAKKSEEESVAAMQSMFSGRGGAGGGGGGGGGERGGDG